MKLTPLDIKKQSFRKVMRGLDPEEVQSYLEMLAEDWGRMQDEVRRLRERQREDAAKLEHYTRVEEALQEALRTARESARRAIANAERKAELLVEAAEQQADATKSAALHERQHILRETKTLGTRRDEITARLRAFLQSELELLERFDEARRPRAEQAAEQPAEPATEPAAQPQPDAQPEESVAAEEPQAGADAEQAENHADEAEDAPEAPPTEPEQPTASPGFRVQPLVADDVPMATEEEIQQIRSLMKDLD